MTLDEIIKIEVLVAEKVFKQPKPTGEPNELDFNAQFLSSGPKEVWRVVYVGMLRYKWTTLPFATDIASAWMVVNKMREGGWSMGLDNGWDPKPPWLCTFGNDDVREFGEIKCFFAEEDTAPLAICLAALRALGVEDASINS